MNHKLFKNGKTQKKTYKNNKVKKVKKNKNQSAGKVIGSGGFGCVFLPALKCKNKKTNTKGKISKMMDKEEAKKDEKLYNFLYNKLKYVPNFQKYYLINNDNVCKPAPLTNEDLNNIEKCSIFQKLNIPKNEVNNNLGKFRILNIEYGGEDIFNIITNEKQEINNFIKKNRPNGLKLLLFDSINESLLNLLINGIIPMNKMNLYHLDIKANNILIKNINNKLYSRIIDWGFATEIKNKEDTYLLNEISFLFNRPPSILIYQNLFQAIYKNKYIKYLKLHKNLNSSHYQKLAIESYKEYLLSKKGHHVFIIPIINNIYNLITNNSNKKQNNINNNVKAEEKIGFLIIGKYLGKILEQYTVKYINLENIEDLEKNNFNIIDTFSYFDNVMKYNLDVFGLISVYMEFLEPNNYFTELYSSYNDIIRQLKKKIAYFIFKYCFSSFYAINPINKSDIKKDIRSLVI